MNNKLNNNFSLRKLLLTALIAGPLATLPAPLWALPDSTTANLTVSTGVTTQQVGTATLNITSPDKAILTWQAFGSGASTIGAGDVINYFLPSATASVLNTVTGNVASQIDGQLISNGNVYVLNPAGIVIGATAQINTGGFYASTVAEPAGFFSINGTLSFAGTSSNNIVVKGTGVTSGTDAATIQAVGPGNKIFLAGNAVNVQGGKFFGNLFVASSSTAASPLSAVDALAVNVNTAFGTTGPVSINTVSAPAVGGGLSITTNGGNVSLSGGSATAASATLAGATVGSIAVGALGTYYTSTPSVTFSGGGGTQAAATAILTNGVVTGFTITNAGSGYTSAPTVTLANPTSLTVSANAAATPAAQVSVTTTGSGLNGAINQGAGAFTASQTGTVVTLNAGTGTTSGNITLGNVNFLTVAASGNAINITDAGGLVLGNTNAAGNLTVNASGQTLGQNGAITVGGTITAYANSITMTGTGNLTFANVAASSTLSLVSTGDIVINGNLNASSVATSPARLVSITSSGGKIDVTPAITTSTLTLAAPAGTINLAGLTTSGTTTGATNSATSITASGNITLAGLTTRANTGGATPATVTSSTGSISLGAITTTSSLTVTATAGNITTTTISHNNSGLTLTANNGTISTGATGHINLTGGTITMSGGTVSLANITSTATTATVTVNSPTGNISVAQINANAGLTLNAPSTTGSVTTTGTITSTSTASLNITSGGSISLANAVTVPVLNLTSTAGSITASSTVTSTSRAVINAAGDVSLATATNNFNNIALIGGASATTGFVVVDANDITLGTGTNTKSAVSITSGKALGSGIINLGAAAGDSLVLGSTLALTQDAGATAGTITTLANSVNVFGAVTVTTAANANATLGSNIFGNAANYSFGQINGNVGTGTLSVYESQTLNLGNITAGSLDARSMNSNIVNTGALSVGGKAIFAANSIFSPGTVTVTNASNSLRGNIVIGNATDFTLVNNANTTVLAGDTLVNGKAASGVTSVTVTGSTLGLANTLNVSPAPGTGGDFNIVSFTAPGAVTISDSNALTVQNLVSTGSGAISVSAAGVLTLGSGIALGGTGATSFTATGASASIVDSAPNIRVNGDVSFTSDNSISITNAGHSMGAVTLNTTGAGTATSANITYTEGGSANLNAVSVNTANNTAIPAGNLTIVSTGGDIIQTDRVGPPAVKGSIALSTSGTGTSAVTFTSNVGAVSLLNPAGTNSILAPITLTAVGNSSVVQSNSTVLGNVAVTGGTLAVNTSGAAAKTITQATGTTVKAYGATSATTQGAKITLANSGNNFGGLTLVSNSAAAAGADIAVTEAGTINFLSVNSGTAGKLTVISENGAIMQSGAGGILVGGTTSLTSSAAGIALNSGTANVFGGNNGISITTAGNAAIQDANAITALAGGTNVGGTLTVRNNQGTTGQIKDISGVVAVTGNVYLDTTTAAGTSINLGSSSLTMGAIQFRSGTVTIVENASLNVASLSFASGPVSLTSSGNISTSGAGGATFQSTLSLNATGTIVISNPIYVNGAGGSGLTFRALGSVDLSSLSKAGNLNNIEPTNLSTGITYKGPNP